MMMTTMMMVTSMGGSRCLIPSFKHQHWGYNRQEGDTTRTHWSEDFDLRHMDVGVPLPHLAPLQLPRCCWQQCRGTGSKHWESPFLAGSCWLYLVLPGTLLTSQSHLLGASLVWYYILPSGKLTWLAGESPYFFPGNPKTPPMNARFYQPARWASTKG